MSCVKAPDALEQLKKGFKAIFRKKKAEFTGSATDKPEDKPAEDPTQAAPATEAKPAEPTTAAEPQPGTFVCTPNSTLECPIAVVLTISNSRGSCYRQAHRS
ncbi:hypothetical protein ASPVEDRAFT_37654 [Aspergillus versicolor CBS 583.65]|uniref:Uncharacterized protein n=1 Tax=Aspergillus versicolor CBS 583.65 TaxID=1036611 RepID=A0A1L9P9J9_ASPVE|nr:uncharacterized protein ASPVEDRAFT_37654 [Aspergillus versicolor CBS 583.65]OJI98210.1 hypothetical protein ASPVEDRAFT_37654 [Aspergillus versicolor CBS 583.65]